MTDFTVYSGEDFHMYLSASDDTGEQAYDLSNYKVIVQLSVDRLGARIIASTEADSEALTLVRGEDNSSFSLSVGHELTQNFDDGFIYLSILLENLTSLERSIAEVKTIAVKHSKLSL